MEGVSAAQLAAFVGVLSLAILSPGPGIVAVSHAAFSMGRRRALPYALGLALGASAWCLVALLGLVVLFRTVPALETVFHVGGGLYLLWVAWKLWRHADDPAGAEPRGGRGLGAGLALNLSNPKPGLFYASVLLSIFPGLGGVPATATVYLVALSVELTYYLGLAVLLSGDAVRARYFALKPWIDRGAALLVALLGALLILRP